MSMKRKLQDVRMYLAGPIEKAIDDGYTWRSKMASELSELGITVWDPLVKPEWFNKECGCIYDGKKQREDFELITCERNKDNCAEVDAAFRRNNLVRDVCLRLVSACDVVICKVGDRTVGTFEELHLAQMQFKPILFWYEEDQIDSSWRIVEFPNALHFQGMDLLVNYLKEISLDAEQVDNEQWIFLDGRWPNASFTTF